VAEPFPPPGPGPGTSATLRRVSGLVLFLGIVLIGVPFLLLGASIGSSNLSNSTLEDMYTLWGLGIIVIGLSLAIARM